MITEIISSSSFFLDWNFLEITNWKWINCITSVAILGLILTQNDGVKELITTKNSPITPLEKATWFSLVLQLSFLLIKIKNVVF